ncbi:MAG: 6-pyruvoyl-tetrahydropterin synthase-related protein [candidate division WOR-3 bacterium]
MNNSGVSEACGVRSKEQPAGAIPKWVLLVAAAVLLLIVALAGFSYIAPGHPTSVDVWPHLVRQRIVYESLKEGTSPFWSFMFYSGYPHLRFYGPLFAFLGGVLAFVTGGGQLLALKVLLFGLYLGSAAVMYLYLWRKTGRKAAAALGTLVYVLVPWRVFFVSIAGNYPLALVFVLLPLCFLALDRLVERAGLADAGLLGLCLGLAMLAHIVYGVFIWSFLVLALVWWLVAYRGRQAGRVLAGAGAAAACGIGLSSFILVPLVLEYGTHAYPQSFVPVGMPRLAALLWPGVKPGGYDGAYIGISVVLLVVASVVLLLVNRPIRREAGFPVAGLALALGFTFVVPRLGRIGQVLTAGLPPVRFLVYWMFFAAVLVALGFGCFESRVKTDHVRFVSLVVIVVALVADCVPTLLNVRHARIRTFLGTRQYVYDVLRSQPTVKVLDVNIPEDRIDDVRRTLRYPATGYLFGRLASPLGPPYHQFAPRSMLYVYPWTNYVAADLGDTTRAALTEGTFKALALMGVSHLITLPALMSTDSAGEFIYLATKQGIAWDDRFLVAQQEPPVVFGPTRAGLVMASNVVRPMSAEQLAQARSFCIAEDWQVFLDSVLIDTSLRRMGFIPAAARYEAESLGPKPDCHVLNTSISNSSVEIELENRSECFLRLALSYYPELSIRFDGRKVDFYETKDHFIWLRCPEGRHRLVVTAPLGRLRSILLAVSILSLAACVLLLAVRTGGFVHRERRRMGTE